MSVGLTRFTTLPAMYKIVGDKSDMKNAAVHGSNGPILLGAEIGGRCLRRTGTGRSTGLVPNPTLRPGNREYLKKSTSRYSFWKKNKNTHQSKPPKNSK
jgi:hypothetical protein